LNKKSAARNWWEIVLHRNTQGVLVTYKDLFILDSIIVLPIPILNVITWASKHSY